MKFKLIENIDEFDNKSTIKLESTLKESEDKSTLTPNYKKEPIELSICTHKIKRNNDEGESITHRWYNDNELVGSVTVDTIPASDNRLWMGDIEVTDDYKGHNLGNQILEYAVNKLGGSALAVHKDNEIAINMYKKAGFHISTDRTDDEYYYMYIGDEK